MCQPRRWLTPGKGWRTKACGVEWFEEDVTEFDPPQRFSLWHDRAVFHFLTAKTDRDRYVGRIETGS